jgi:hypothetical protein
MLDLDLLSLFPSIRGKNHGGIERNQASQGQNGGGKVVERVGNQWARTPP